jgi:hypothetical protein
MKKTIHLMKKTIHLMKKASFEDLATDFFFYG